MIDKICFCAGAWLAALGFLGLSFYTARQKRPVNFWSKNLLLPERVRDPTAFNRAVARLYRLYALPFLVTGALSLLFPLFGLFLSSLHLAGVLTWLRSRYIALERAHTDYSGW